ncbi:hypothetical protein Osc7112_6855 (plasmid) [Oscillatoria nigro-viridis PCC 7112]|uniref:Uncharacterized protein n=1 Tax=Phormidium nigroviride PCC 7112 TaxID=179408 RepID=K9VS90_9CYAN|nr:hypothetical protein [Oscillatoria nigro-viridis]AFZ10938.1 hypothetical protein Osc7112_6855 [Oscillatoria nigro-viridis PCC 7112]
MLSKIIGALATSTLNAVFDAAFDELKRRGEIIEDESLAELTSDKIKIFAHLGLKIKLVVEPDFACWYVYDGDPDPIEIGVEENEDRAFDSATKWVDWYLSGEWKLSDRSSYSTDPQRN